MRVISYFAKLQAKLGIDTSQFDKGLRAASTSSTQFAKKVAKDFQKTAGSANKASNSLKVFGDSADKGYKSVKRIAQGIIFSQAFYKTINAIRSATREMYQFTQGVEESRVAFTGLIGEADKAERFNAMLQDLAADTPYIYEQAAENARMLLAYEFPLKSMERIMLSVADATAASGKTESFGNISQALGQIQAKGRLTSRELIRLANAGIPAYQILREELSLTHNQIANLGKTPIAADIAIPAILRGMDKRYKGAAKAMQRTTKGITNAIRENLLIITQKAFDPMYQNFRVNIEKISDKLEKMKADMRVGGIGHMLENMFPEEAMVRIRLFAANIKMFIENVAGFLKALVPVRNAVVGVFINAFNMAMPVINAVTRVIVVLTQILLGNSQAVRILVGSIMGLLIMGSMIGIILGFAKALKSLFIARWAAQGVVNLAKAIGLLTKAIITNPFVAFTAVVVGGLIAMSSYSTKFRNSINKMFGGVSKTFGVDPSKIFTPKMEENTKIADEFNQELELSSKNLKDMGNKAKEAGKKAKNALMSFDEVFTLPDDVDSAGGGLDDIFDIPDFDVPTIPPFDYSDMFPDVGAAITEWTSGVAEKISSTLSRALVGVGLGSIIGGAIGAAIGGPGGAVIGAKIGALAGGIASLFWEDLKNAFSSTTGQAAMIGGSIGAIIGFAFGGPFGAAIGAVLAGGLSGLLAASWDKIWKWTKDTAKAIGSWSIETLSSIDSWSRDTLNSIVDWVFETDEAFTGWVTSTIENLNEWTIEFYRGLWNWAKESARPIGAWINDSYLGFTSWVSDTARAFGSWSVETIKDFGTWAKDTGKSISSWTKETGHNISVWAGDAWKALKDWWNDTKEGFGEWTRKTGETFSDGLDTKLGDIWEWSKDSLKSFTDWAGDSIKGFLDWDKETTKNIEDWALETYTSISTWSKDTLKSFGSWVAESYNGFKDWGKDTTERVSTWYTDTKQFFSDWWDETSFNFGEWWKDSLKGFGDWAKDVYDDVTGWFDKTAKKVKEFFDNLKFWKKEASSVGTSVDDSGYSGRVGTYSITPDLAGHMRGGVFNKEHVARFNEGNKMEAILPVENPSAMAQVRRAIFGGDPADFFRDLMSYMAPMHTQPVTPVYVNTLIADERGLRELERRMYEIRKMEDERRGV